MEIVYASLKRRPGETVRASEAAEVVDALWAHASPGDGLQHASTLPAPDRVDLLLYLLSQGPSDSPDPVGRAHDLLSRSHRTSPVLQRYYLPPEPPEPANSTTG